MEGQKYLNEGDIIVCDSCSHTRVVQDDWLEKTAKEYTVNLTKATLPVARLKTRLKCSECNLKNAIIMCQEVSPEAAVKEEELAKIAETTDTKGYIASLSDSEREAFVRWMRRMTELNKSNESFSEKAQKAMDITKEEGVPTAVLQGVYAVAKRHLWDNRSYMSRGAIAVAAGTMALFGSSSVGIAAGGGAVGVPILLLTPWGGALLGAIWEELNK